MTEFFKQFLEGTPQSLNNTFVGVQANFYVLLSNLHYTENKMPRHEKTNFLVSDLV